MSKRKLHDVKFKFKAIYRVCEKQSKEAPYNIVLYIYIYIIYINGKRVLVVLCSHLKFLISKKGCPNRLVHVVLSNDAFLFQSAYNGLLEAFSYHYFLYLREQKPGLNKDCQWAPIEAGSNLLEGNT